MVTIILFSGIALSSSEPDANASDPLGAAHSLACLTCVVGSAAELAFPGHANVRSKLTANFVTQPQTQVEFGQASPHLSLRVILAIEICFHLRLQDQALR